ncbi:MAG TPA: CHAD domain-containing protein [Methanocella sp.]|nr:CHAD domain-containing protein [Methanocella sp.]
MKRGAFVRKADVISRQFADSVPAVLTFADPEDLHRMRVAGRSLLACISLVPKSRRARHRWGELQQAVHQRMQLLGRLRDLDVLIEELSRREEVARADEFGLIRAWGADLVMERYTVRMEASSSLPRLETPAFRHLIDRWLRNLSHTKRSNRERRIRKLRKNFQEAITALDDLDTTLSPDDENLLDRLHKARIRAKKLRYALDITGEGDENLGEIDRIKALQERLGKVQDRRIWLSRLMPYRASYPEAVEHLSETLRTEIIALLADKES